MIGAPPTKFEVVEQIDTIVRAVDEAGRALDERWGYGRLPRLVPIDWAERFRSQRRKFSAAILDRDVDDVRKHGDAMLRAYAKLDELAAAAGHEPGPPDQWEFEGPDGPVVLIRDVRRLKQIKPDGRKVTVWSLDEVSQLIRGNAVIVAAKLHFDGAEVETVRPPRDLQQELNDELPW